MQLLKGIHYIHSASLLHRDLKPENILINPDNSIKICDFGLSRSDVMADNAMLTHYVITRYYRAPEVIVDPMTYDRLVPAIACKYF